MPHRRQNRNRKGFPVVHTYPTKWYPKDSTKEHPSSILHAKLVYNHFGNIKTISSSSQQLLEIQDYFMNPLDIQEQMSASTRHYLKEMNQPLSSDFHQGHKMYQMIPNTEENPVTAAESLATSPPPCGDIRNTHDTYENTVASRGNQAPPHIAFPEDPFQRRPSCLICKGTGRPLFTCGKCLGGKPQWGACTSCE